MVVILQMKFWIGIELKQLSFNSLAPGKFEWYFRYLNFQIISVIDWGIFVNLPLD